MLHAHVGGFLEKVNMHDMPFMTLPYEKLVQLAEKPIVEAEGSKFFREFELAYEAAKEQVKKTYGKHKVDATYQIVLNSFLKKHCPPIEYIGEGSSRAAFALDGGLCLKVAMTSAGIAQNKTEARNFKRVASCFPRFHGIGNDGASLLVECVTTFKDDEELEDKIQKHLGIVCGDCCCAISELLVWMDNAKENDGLRFDEALKQAVQHDISDDWRELASAISHPKNEAQKTLSELAKFAFAHSRDLIADDLEFPENWGLAVRNGEVVPVVLDAGFSEAVYNRFYS